MESFASAMTETVSPPSFATKTSPFAGSYATAKGFPPTSMFATTELLASEMTETVPFPKLVTKTSPLEGS